MSSSTRILASHQVAGHRRGTWPVEVKEELGRKEKKKKIKSNQILKIIKISNF